MKTTIEISKYPLSEDYEPPIIDFINRLSLHDEIVLKTNATSTHISGEYDLVMSLLKKEIKNSFEKFGKSIFVIKVLLGELDI